MITTHEAENYSESIKEYDRIVKMWRYVIAIAIQDTITKPNKTYKQVKQDNVRYIFESVDFIKVCEFAELEADYVRREFKDLKDPVKLKEIQQKLAGRKKINNTRLIKTIIERLNYVSEN